MLLNLWKLYLLSFTNINSKNKREYLEHSVGLVHNYLLLLSGPYELCVNAESQVGLYFTTAGYLKIKCAFKFSMFALLCDDCNENQP